MRRVFADAQFFVALLVEKDQGHSAARDAGRLLHGATLLTTEEILGELLAYLGSRGPFLRKLAADYVDELLRAPEVVVYPQSHESFLEGFALYRARPDKGYSLIDCISMTVMRREGVAEILTADDHFAQEGFTRLT